MPNLRSQTENLLAASRSILFAAEAMEWEKVERLGRERMALMENLFSSAKLATSDIEFLARAIEEVWIIDGQVVFLIEAERDRAAHEMRMLKIAQHGEQAYRSAEHG